MLTRASERFSRLSTTAKLLLILTAALLPIGLALIWVAQSSIREAHQAQRSKVHSEAHAAAIAVHNLIARHILGLRVAASGALAIKPSDPCQVASHSLASSPAISRSFSLRAPDGKLLCAAGGFVPRTERPLIAPGDFRLWVERDGTLTLRVGVAGGMATTALAEQQLQEAARARSSSIASLVISDGQREMRIFDSGRSVDAKDLTTSSWRIANGQLEVRAEARAPRVSTIDRLVLSLPLLMWVTAALISWLLVSRLLIRPLRRLGRAVTRLQPGEGAEALPRKLGPATEIQGLRDAFARALERIEQSEVEMAAALEGQRRLVREVHHRVKNNLQVVASLLNIHGRSADTAEARAAYAGIARRVGALSIVHRNHFAEMEDNRGIAIRPLIAELAAELRAGAPDSARGLAIELDIAPVFTTQDAAVSTAFLVTEIVEFAMLNCPQEPIEIALRRTSELTAKLTMSSPILVPDDEDAAHKVQFERIVSGLAKQLRSSLERKLGRYAVELPVFPAT